MRIRTEFFGGTPGGLSTQPPYADPRSSRFGVCLRGYEESERTGRVLERPAPPKATGDARMSEDAKTVVLSHLKAAVDELMEVGDFDAILYVVALMRRVHDAS